MTADLTPTVPLPFSPEYSCFTHFLSAILFYSKENIEQLPFKVKLPEVTGEPPQVSFTPWSKTELRAIVKEFSQPREEPPTVIEEFRVTVRLYVPKLLDLYPLVHVLVGLGEAPEWMREAK